MPYRDVRYGWKGVLAGPPELHSAPAPPQVAPVKHETKLPCDPALALAGHLGQGVCAPLERAGQGCERRPEQVQVTAVENDPNRPPAKNQEQGRRRVRNSGRRKTRRKDCVPQEKGGRDHSHQAHHGD